MRPQKILILGGAGFIGASLAQMLVKRGDDVTIPTRHRERAKHLFMLPTCEVVEANVHDPATLAALVHGRDVVVNLIGILHGDFEAVHVVFARRVAEACAAAGVKRLLHMSALNADGNGPSEYLRSRWRGEAAVHAVARAHGLALTMFRPSVVFGEHDRFLNLFARLVNVFPLLPLGSPHAEFQVVWVEDVARALTIAIETPATIGHTYPLVGPDVFTLRALIDFVIDTTRANCIVVNLGAALSILQATVFGLLPGKLITRDNVASMSIPNISKEGFPPIFGTPAPMRATVHEYMQKTQGRGRYPSHREAAGR